MHVVYPLQRPPVFAVGQTPSMTAVSAPLRPWDVGLTDRSRRIPALRKLRELDVPPTRVASRGGPLASDVSESPAFFAQRSRVK